MIAAVLVCVAKGTAAGAAIVGGGCTSVAVSGGLELYSGELIGMPAVPAPTLRLEVANGLSDRIDMRLQVTSLVGLFDRVGVGPRVKIAGSDDWSLAIALRPSVQMFWLPHRLTGGNYAVTGEVLLASDTPFGRLNPEIGCVDQPAAGRPARSRAVGEARRALPDEGRSPLQ